MGYTLRVSVLDACQLRCTYCLPNGMHQVLNKRFWLTPEHYLTIAHAIKPLTIDKVRFTGGEPLLRAELPDIIAAFRSVFPEIELSLTTNGLRFFEQRDRLRKSGLSSVTFHVDTLKAERYHAIMGNGDLCTVHRAIASAQEVGLPVKLNVVVQKGVNDDELMDFLRWSKEINSEVRFIELMNTGSAKDYVAKTFISGDEILARIGQNTPISVVGRSIASAPAEHFLAHDLGVKFGLIASDTKPFCANCNRLRLSADGRLRTCLYEPQGQMLKSMDHETLMQEIASIVARKTSFHPALKKARSDFSMSHVGG